MNWRSFLFNRYTFTFGVIAAVTLVWNLYIAMNSDGIIQGRVVGPDGRPAAEATVILFEKTLFAIKPRDQATTDKDGRFVFKGHDFYRIWLEAKSDIGAYPQTEYRMYFRRQNLTLDKPLRLEPVANVPNAKESIGSQ
jgi:hypothetical protein